MAVLREKEFTIDLSAVVKSRLDSFNNLRNSIRARREVDFQNMVLAGMSYANQLEYRNQQLKKEEESEFPDNNYINELKSEISNLKKLARYEKLRNDFNDSWQQYTLGKQSIDKVISLLKNQLSTEQDPDYRTIIQDELNKAEQEQRNNELTALSNKVKLTEQDRSISLINSVIDEVQSKRSQAVLAGRQDEVTAYDVTLQALQSRKAIYDIEDKTNDLEAKYYTQGGDAIQKMSWLNNLISSSDSTTPIFVNNVRYNSESDYWKSIKNQYISGTGSGIFSDFITEFTNKIDTDIAKISLSNSFGYVPISKIDEVNNTYKSLIADPAYAAVANILENARVNSVSKIVNQIATAVENETAFTLDFTKGENALNQLQKVSGINMTTEITNLRQSIVKNLATQQAAYSEAAEVLAEQRGIPVEEAMKIVTGQVPGITSGELPTAQILSTTPITPTTPASIPAAPSTGYTGTSIVDYLKSIGQPSDFASRAKLAQQKGITNYTGTAEQNTQLLQLLKTTGVTQPSTVSTTSVSTPTTPTTTSKTTPAPTTTSTSTKTTTPTTAQTSAQTSTQTPASTPAPSTGYTGTSIVDYLKSIGQPSDFASRAKLAQQKGITNYTGTAEQNTQLLKTLRGF